MNRNNKELSFEDGLFSLQLKPNSKPVYCLHKQDLATAMSLPEKFKYF